MPRLAGVVLGSVMGAVLMTSCAFGGGEPPEPPPTVPSPTLTESFPAGLDAYYQQDVDWRDCGAGWLCGTVRVPKDYASPGAGGEFQLSVMRLPAKGENRIGSMLVNPGGPGGSGLDYARMSGLIVSPEVLEAYDIVGFDPRGVAESNPVDCLTDKESDALVETDSTPDDQAEVDRLIAAAGAVGEQCAQRSPEIFRWMDTVSAAKDMDILRYQVGDAKLNYLGKSYGTQLGAVYAEHFPDKVGRLVLDGALPVDLTSDELSHGQAAAFETALQRFVADCLPKADCPLRAAGVDEGVRQIQQFLSGLDAAPIPARPGRPLTEALAVNAVLYYLYFPPSDWASLREGLAAGFAGDGAPLLNLLDERLQRDPLTGSYANNALEAFYAVSCLDRPANEVSEVAANAEDWAADAPTFGPSLAWSDATCAQWPVGAVSQPRTVAAAGSDPILVVSTQYDPATPYDWGVRMAQSFDNAALVSWNGDGHTAYRNGNECVDAAVDEYFLTGEVPDSDPRCGY